MSEIMPLFPGVLEEDDHRGGQFKMQVTAPENSESGERTGFESEHYSPTGKPRKLVSSNFSFLRCRNKPGDLFSLKQLPPHIHDGPPSPLCQALTSRTKEEKCHFLPGSGSCEQRSENNRMRLFFKLIFSICLFNCSTGDTQCDISFGCTT